MVGVDLEGLVTLGAGCPQLESPLEAVALTWTPVMSKVLLVMLLAVVNLNGNCIPK